MILSRKDRVEFHSESLYDVRMFLAETNKARRLLHLSFIGHVTIEDLRQSREELLSLLAELPAGLDLLTDLSHLKSMDIACEAEIARMMKAFDLKGISSVIRVIPDPRKDIGFNILTALRYERQMRVVVCKSIEEAIPFLNFSDPVHKGGPNAP